MRNAQVARSSTARFRSEGFPGNKVIMARRRLDAWKLLMALAWGAALSFGGSGCSQETNRPTEAEANASTSRRQSRPYMGPYHVEMTGGAFSRDNRRLLICYDTKNVDPIDKKTAPPPRLRLGDLATGKELWTADASEPLTPIGFLPGDQVVLLRGRSDVQVWDAVKGRLARRFAYEKGRDVEGAMLSADGKRLLLVRGTYLPLSPTTERRPIEIWDTVAEKRLVIFGPHDGAGTGMFSPDAGKVLWVSSVPEQEGNTDPLKRRLVLHTSDIATGDEIMHVTLPVGVVLIAGLFPDKTHVIAAVRDDNEEGKGAFVLLELATGEIVRRLGAWKEYFTLVSGGQYLLSAKYFGEPKGGCLTLVDVAAGRVKSQVQLDADSYIPR